MPSWVSTWAVGRPSRSSRAHDGGNVIKVLVPWARRDLTVTVDPEEVFGPTDYTLTVERTTVIADRDHDGVPDVADHCPAAKGPSAGAGCPDTDSDSVFDVNDRCPKVPGIGADGCPTAKGETVVAILDGKKVDAENIYTRHGVYRFLLNAAILPGRHVLTVTLVRRRQAGHERHAHDRLTDWSRSARSRDYTAIVLIPGVWSARVNSTNSVPSSSMCALWPGRM